MRKYSVLIAAALLSALGCTDFNDPRTKDIEELAASSTEFVVSEYGGSVPIPVYSSGKVNVEILGDVSDWADIDRTTIDGDATLLVFVNPNTSFKRSAIIRLTLEETGRTLELKVKQNGIDQSISSPSLYADVSGQSDGQVRYTYSTDVAADKLQTKIEYVGVYKDWISGVSVDNGTLTVSTMANPSDISRRARISLYFIDGWNEKKGIEVFLTQSDCDGKVGSDITFSRIKSYASAGGSKIEDDWLLEGIVVSDCSSANMDLNPYISSSMVDTTISRRTVYLEGVDGSWGLRMHFADASDNKLTFGMKVKVNLYGTTAYMEPDPDRYSVEGLSGWNLVSSEAGVAVPVKEKKISELDDSDIYTFVMLKDTEFAFKKGSYADVLETNAVGSAASSASALDGWASLLVDDRGDGIYAPVNMMCSWRRTGSGVPQGVGTTAGVIVHNDMKRLGDAGRYQIRVLDEKGFDMSAPSDLKEYAYIINSYSNVNAYAAIDSRYKYNKLATVIPSNDILDAAPARMEMISENTVVPASRQNDPYTTAKYYNAKDKGPDYDGVSTEWVGIGDITTARDWYRWTSDGEFAGYNGFVFSLSTESLASAGYAEFAFDFAGGYTSAGTARSWPAHWCVEYSVNGGGWKIVPNCVNAAPYVHMRGLSWSKTYYNGQWYQTPEQAGLGFSQHSFRLPEETLGVSDLKIRLRPYDRYIVSLPLEWEDDVEQSQIDSSTDVDIRIRFGFIYLRYR